MLTAVSGEAPKVAMMALRVCWENPESDDTLVESGTDWIIGIRNNSDGAGVEDCAGSNARRGTKSGNSGA